MANDEMQQQQQQQQIEINVVITEILNDICINTIELNVPNDIF